MPCNSLQSLAVARLCACDLDQLLLQARDAFESQLFGSSKRFVAEVFGQLAQLQSKIGEGQI